MPSSEPLYFVLSNTQLSAYASQRAATRKDEPLASLLLDHITALSEKLQRKEFAIFMQTNSQGFMRSLMSRFSVPGDDESSIKRSAIPIDQLPIATHPSSFRQPHIPQSPLCASLTSAARGFHPTQSPQLRETEQRPRGNQSNAEAGPSPALISLIARTPFEAEAWVSCMREAMHALVEAAESREWAHVIALTEVGRDVNLRARGNGRTALHYAAGYGEVEVADVLLRAGAETDVVGMLLKHNADPLIKVHSGVLVGKTAITLARLYGSHAGASLKGTLTSTFRIPFPLEASARRDARPHKHAIPAFEAVLTPARQVLAVSRYDSGERYAMKSVMKHGSSDAVAQARVEREILQRVAHPFIIQLHCAFQTRERLLLVLEICPGGDLKAQLSRCGRFSSEVAAFISGQRLLIVQGFVRLADFNVAKMMEGRRTFSFKGTIFCMAPEVLLKKGHDFAADFWSLGVLLYELACGGPPFYSSDKQQLKQQILGMDPRRYNLSFPAYLSTECRMVLSQLLVRDPKLRLGARKQDVATIKAPVSLLQLNWMQAHPFFNRLDWDKLLARQIPSPLLQSVEMIAQSRQQKSLRQRLDASDTELVPSYLSEQSCLVEDWDY
ncbi:MAG: hypothetical protein SGPRY_009137, partial [Prymnesium sp.]